MPDHALDAQTRTLTYAGGRYDLAPERVRAIVALDMRPEGCENLGARDQVPTAPKAEQAPAETRGCAGETAIRRSTRARHQRLCMKPALSLLSLALLAALPVATAGLPVQTKEICVNYAYVADYQWYYVCANPGDSSCVVSLMRSNGVSRDYDCYGADVNVRDVCGPEIGDMDHRSSLCASADLDCPVYLKSQNGSKRCLA